MADLIDVTETSRSLICLKGRHILSCFLWTKVSALLIFPVMGKYILVSEHSLLFDADIWFCAKEASGIFTAEFKMDRIYNESRSHCYLEGNLLITNLLHNVRSSQKSSFEYLPWVLLCEQGHLSPQKSVRSWASSLFLLYCKGHT